MEKQIKLFLKFIETEKKLSSNTLQSYNRDLQQFREYLSDVEVRYTHVHEEHIKNYISELEKMGKAAEKLGIWCSRLTLMEISQILKVRF